MTLSSLLRRGSLIAVAALLAACAYQGPRERPADREQAWQELRAGLESIETWRAQGRMSVRTASDGGSAGFDWREQGDGRFELRLAGPWGQGVARLSGTRNRAVLDEGNGRILRGRDAGRLLRRAYDWNIPVSELRRWLIGLPAADEVEVSYTLDVYGRLETLDWEDWQITYGRYRQRDDLDLPAELTIDNSAEAVRIRVAIDDWDLDPPAQQQDEPRDDDGSGVPLIGG